MNPANFDQGDVDYLARSRAPLVLPIDEVCTMLHCGRTRVFELIADGTLVRAPKFGKKTVVLAESVFAALEAEYHPAPPKPRKRARKGMTAEFDALLDRTRGRALAAHRALSTERMPSDG